MLQAEWQHCPATGGEITVRVITRRDEAADEAAFRALHHARVAAELAAYPACRK